MYNLLKLYITSASKYSLLAGLEIRGNMFYEAVYEDNYVMDLQLGLWNNILN